MLSMGELATTKNFEACKLGSKANEPRPALNVLNVVSGLVTNACISPLGEPAPGRTYKS
jgi:hypothetical protein